MRARVGTHRAVVALAAFGLSVAACTSTTDTATPSAPLSAATTFVPAVASGSSPSSAEASTTGESTVTSTTLAGSATTAPSVNAATTAPPSTDDAAAQAPVSPLAEYLGTGSIGSDFDAGEYQRQNEKKEEAIAACMKAEGFDYIPYSPDSYFQVVPASGGGGVAQIGGGQGQLGEGLSDEEFAAQYGYGISTNDEPPPPAEVDPNDAIVDALSVSGRVAYYHALYGPDVSLQSDGHLAHKELPFDDSSCWRKASDEVFGTVPEVDSSVLAAFQPLLDEIGRLSDRVLADPRLVAALQEWSDCMAGAGFPGYTDLNKPRQDVSDRADTVLGPSRDPARADPQQLAEVRAFETSIATADLHCTSGYGTTYSAVQLEIETAFVNDNRAQLEQYRDALAAASGENGNG